MGSRGYRIAARLAVASLVVALVLPLGATGAAAAGSGISLTVHLGYQDVLKAGDWMPVTVDVHSSGPAVDGTLEVQESLNAQPYVSGFAIYQQPLSLTGGATKRIRTYVSIDTTGASVTARIIENGRVLASQDSLASSSTTTLIGVLSDQSTTLDDVAAIHPASLAARVVHLHLDELPDSAIALRAFDILAVDDFATDGLTLAQRAAIADYVYNGGNLLVGTGAAWHKTLAGLPSSILPVNISGTAVVDATAPGTSAVEVATGTITSGNVWLSDNGQPLIIERAVGAGSINLATFDFNQQPLVVSDASRAVLRQLMSRAIFTSIGQTPNYAVIGLAAPVMGGFGTTRPTLALKSGALTSVLGNLPGLDLPSLQLTGLLVLLYVLVVGPINYIVLGAMHRRALAWVTVPLIAIVASAGAYGTGVFTKGRSVQTNQVAIVHIQPAWSHAYQETYTGVIPPSRGDYQASVGAGQLMISPIASTYGGVNQSIRVDTLSNNVTLPSMTAFSLGGFATEGLTSAPALTAHLSLVNGKLHAVIENHSNVTFSDGVFIGGGAFTLFNSLAPGATTSVDVTPVAPNINGQPLYMRVYNSNIYYGGYGPGGPSMSAADRDKYAKSQILAQLTTGGSFKGVYAPSAPLIVAWTHQSFQDLTVSGNHPRSTALAAVALSLPVDQIGTGTLPAGVVNSRIVDVVGDSQGQGPPGTLVLQNGGVTYEFTPSLAPGTHLTGVSVVSQNPYGGKFLGPPTPGGGNSPGVQGQAWDWSSSTWVDIAFQDNGTTALPDGAVNPLTGVVRVRISASNGSFLAGTLALSGTVQ